MDKSASERIQSSQAKSGGDMSSAGFAARAQSAGDRWSNTSGGGNSKGTVGGSSQNMGSGSMQGSSTRKT
ncbi:hypothetical protein B7463_g11126, partial [Scytalidium lignicola]